MKRDPDIPLLDRRSEMSVKELIMTIPVLLAVIVIVVLIATVIQDTNPGVSAIDWIPGRASLPVKPSGSVEIRYR
jgi:hypothetical protein